MIQAKEQDWNVSIEFSNILMMKNDKKDVIIMFDLHH